MKSLLLLFLTVASAFGFTYPLKVASSGRYLVDQTNAPFLVVGDSAWSLICNLTPTQAASYFVDRQAHGFNSVLLSLLCYPPVFGNAKASTYDGIAPFTGSNGAFYDLSTPNPAYFARVDFMINLAASYGITVFLVATETAGWMATFRNQGISKCTNFGKFLGNRYKTSPNIIWWHGNDFQTWETSSDDALVLAVAHGIQSVDTNHLQTVELDYFESTSLDDSNWAPVVKLNGAYTYGPAYGYVLRAYNQSSSVPIFLMEGSYEFEHNGSRVDPGTPEILRRQQYYTLSSGGTGFLYGSGWTDRFGVPPPGYRGIWQSNLDTPGVQQIQILNAFFTKIAWFDLIPDQNHLLLTAGYGTFASTGLMQGNDYVTAAATTNGTLAVVFMPQVTTITLDMSKFAGPVTAQWFDPSNGAYTPISGSPFANTGARQLAPQGKTADGLGDWVLLLQAY